MFGIGRPASGASPPIGQPAGGQGARVIDRKPIDKLCNDLEVAFTNAYDSIRTNTQQVKGGEILTTMQWYQKVYAVVATSTVSAEIIYKRFALYMQKELQIKVVDPLLSLINSNDMTLFTEVSRQYRMYCVFRQFVKTVLQYIDTYYVLRQNKAPVTSVMNLIFHNAVYGKVKKVLCQMVLRQVNAHRQGEMVNLQQLQSAIQVFTELSLVREAQSQLVDTTPPGAEKNGKPTQTASPHVNESSALHLDFLNPYLQETGSFYRAAASKYWNSTGGTESFLEWVEGRFELEERLVKNLLPPELMLSVRRVLNDALLVRWMGPLIAHPTSGLRTLIATSRLDDVQRMYRLLHPLEGSVALMAKEISDAVNAEAESSIKIFTVSTAPTSAPDGAGPPRDTRETEATLIVSLVATWARFKTLLRTSLEDNKLLREGMCKGFRDVFNVQQQASEKGTIKSRLDVLSEVFAAYLDVLCRRELKETLDEAAEAERIETVVAFVVQLQDKDVFQEAHRAKLAKRLLQTTVHAECERAVVEKLQRALGKSFTFKMEQMMRDHEATADLQSEFAQQQQQQPGAGGAAEFVAQVLTAAHWPAYRSDALTPPQSLEAGMRSFRFFYTKKHASRTLTWVHMLGTSQLQIAFPKGTKDVACTLFQACILLRVAEEPRQRCAVERIASSLSLPLALVKPLIGSMYLHKVFNLLSLCDANGALCPPGKAINDSDVLTLNRDYVHKLRKFKLAAPVSSKRDGEPTRPELDKQRAAQVDAAIVRVMKSQASTGLLYPELVDKTLQQLAHIFVPTPAFIKQRVEDLIIRAYMRRDENNHALLQYIA